MADVIEIKDINTFEGSIPSGYDLIVYEHGADARQGLILYGFDEIRLFADSYKVPAYAFVNVFN